MPGADPSDRGAASAPDAPSSWALHRWSLRYSHFGGQTFTELEALFQERQSQRYAVSVRLVTVLFFLANVALVYYDWRRFIDDDATVVAGGPPATADTPAFTAATAIRLGGLLPLCAAIVGFTYTRAYARTAQPLGFLIWMVGNCLIAYSVVGANPGYGVLALLMVYLYSFTPVNVWLSSLVCAALVLTFGLAVGLTRSRWAASSSLDAGAADGNFGVSMLDIVGVLVVFAVIVGFISHNLEYWLRLSFLDEVRLSQEKAELEKEKRLSEALLITMVPPSILAQLQAGRTMIADSIPAVTVLFCELKLDVYRLTAGQVVRVLNMVYSCFDALIDAHGMHKVETVGDVYLAVAGCPQPAEEHAAAAATMALAMQAAMGVIRREVEAEVGVAGGDLELRIGLNSGPICAGVVGVKNPRWVFGWARRQ